MWPFQRKRHLEYPSTEAWLASLSLTTSIWEIADPAERDQRIVEYGELQRHLFANHASTLTAEEQRQLAEGSHPSQSHRFADRASLFAELLQDHLAADGILATVSLCWYHADRIVLNADLVDDPRQRSGEFPPLFHGFEVRYCWSTTD